MNLNSATSNQVPQLAQIATHFAGHMALRLVHDHLLRMDLTKYEKIIRSRVNQIYRTVIDVRKVSRTVCMVMSLCMKTVSNSICLIFNSELKRH